MKMFSRSGCISLIALLFAGFSFGQKVMQLEKVGSFKTQKIYPGQELIFQKKGFEGWETATLTNILPEDSIVVLNNQYVKLREIAALKSTKNRGWSRIFGQQFYIFGTAWSLFTLGDELASPNYRADWELAAYVTSAAFLSGFALQQGFKSKTYRMGKKYRLRLLDLTITNELLKPS